MVGTAFGHTGFAGIVELAVRVTSILLCASVAARHLLRFMILSVVENAFTKLSWLSSTEGKSPCVHWLAWRVSAGAQRRGTVPHCN